MTSKVTVSLERSDALGVGLSLVALVHTKACSGDTAGAYQRVGEQLAAAGRHDLAEPLPQARYAMSAREVTAAETVLLAARYAALDLPDAPSPVIQALLDALIMTARKARLPRTALREAITKLLQEAEGLPDRRVS